MKTTMSKLDHLVGADLISDRTILVDQPRIDTFADVTEDRQWIHTDPERAAAGPFSGTIAHGFLTLSLLSAFLEGLLQVTDAASAVNYGLDRVRFPAPVPVGSTIGATGRVAAVTEKDGWKQVNIEVTLRATGSPKPACVATFVVRYLPGPNQ